MNRKRLPLSIVLVIVGLLTIFASQTGATRSQVLTRPSAVLSSPLSDAAQVKQAQQRAQSMGRYHYHTTLIQTTWPLPKLENVGLSASEARLYLEGEVNLVEDSMHMRLWSQGGNVAASAESLEIKIAGDTAYGRTGDSDWQEVANLTDLFAPNNDPLAYLQGARNIQNQGTETRAGLTFARYTFDIDRSQFARYMRDQLQDALVR